MKIIPPLLKQTCYESTPRRNGEGQRLQDEGSSAILQLQIAAVSNPAPNGLEKLCLRKRSSNITARIAMHSDN